MIISFVAGGILTAADKFPGSQIAKAYEGGRALYIRLTAYQNVYDSDLWFPERRPDRGVSAYRPSLAQGGVTLFTGHETAAYLMSMDGETLHEWRRPFSAIWTEESGIKGPRPDEFVYFRKAMVYPNGDLLAVVEGNGDTPYGYGVVKLDRDSNVVWSYFGRAHHDLDIGPDGRIYTLTHSFTQTPLKDYDNIATPRLDDYLVVLSPDGKELKKIRLIDIVARSEYGHMLRTVSSYAVADALHTNNVDLITEEMAKNFPFGKAGQVLLSFRELNAIGVLDLDTEKLVWMTRGPWIGQHDPDILPNGHITLFDNYGNYNQANGGSRVIEFDPRTMEIVWEYAGTEQNPLDSQIRSEQERLPNGNTLITESNGGRLVEVTPAGEIAWEYVNPVRGSEPGEPPRIAILNWGQRLDPAGLKDFLQMPAETAQLSQQEYRP